MPTNRLAGGLNNKKNGKARVWSGLVWFEARQAGRTARKSVRGGLLTLLTVTVGSTMLKLYAQGWKCASKATGIQKSQ